MSDLIFHAGAECYDLYGTLSKRTSLEEDVVETFTRTGGNAYYIDRNGVLRLAEANVLRTEWTGSSFDTPNLLLEGARTNGLTRSEELNDGVWTKNRASISADATTAPDGATTADKLVEDSTSSATHEISRDTPTLTDDTLQVLSVFAKAAERSEIRIGMWGKDNTLRSAWFDLSAGTVGTTLGVASARITALADGWYRCEVVSDSNSGGTTPFFRIRLGSGSENRTYDGDGASGLYLWGIQFEADRPFASSHIKTIGSTVTRNAERLYFPFVAPPQEMTVYSKFIERGASLLSAGGVMFIGTSSPTTDPRLLMQGNANGTYSILYDNGVDGAISVGQVGTVTIGESIELRGVLESDGGLTLGQSIDGAAETTNTANAPSAGIVTPWAGQRVYIGSRGGSDRGFNAFRSIKIARGTKTMSEMRSLGV